MTNKPIKILEISGVSWLGGISVHPYMPTGGLFQQATNYDPFEKVGVFIPNKTPAAIDAGDITVSFKFMISYTKIGTTTTILGFADATKAFEINTSNDQATDVSSSITDIATIRGAIKFQGKVVYASDTSVKANALPLAIGSQVGILSVSAAGHIMYVAPDRNLYVTNGKSIARITSVTDKTLNTAAFLTFEDDVICRGLTDDGQHLIIVGDTNIATPTGVVENNRCFVAFWNMKSQDLTRIWSFNDSHISGVVTQEDEVIVYGLNNTYTCTVNSQPKPLLFLGGNSSLGLPSAVNSPRPGSILKRTNGTIVWGIDASMRGYGRIHPSMNKVLFTGYTLPISTEIVLSSIEVAKGTTQTIYTATDGNKLYSFSAASTEIASLGTAGVMFDKPYKFAFAKVILNNNLASGQSVDLDIKTGDGDQIVLRTTREQANSFSFTNFGAKKSHIFHPYPDVDNPTTSNDIFEDLSDFKIINKGASIKKVEIWGYEVPPHQDNYL